MKDKQYPNKYKSHNKYTNLASVFNTHFLDADDLYVEETFGLECKSGLFLGRFPLDEGSDLEDVSLQKQDINFSPTKTGIIKFVLVNMLECKQRMLFLPLH